MTEFIKMSETGAVGRLEADVGMSKSKNLLRLFLQLFHLVLAAAILMSGFAEFSVEPTIFDVFGAQRTSVPEEVFKVMQ
jgi:hypothetical protein